MRHAVLALLVLAPPAAALEPAEVVVVFNSASPQSKRVADHYAAVRKVPADNLIGLLLPTTDDISRADYDDKLAGPLRQRLIDRRSGVKCLLTVWGVPFRVGPLVRTAAQKAEGEKAKAEADAAQTAGDARRHAELTARWADLTGDQSGASVDSELMLLWWGAKYSPARWVANPLYWRVPPADRAKSPPVLVTARLDGPTPDIAMRLADDAVAAEAAGGPTGKAYFDAKGTKYDPANPQQATGYEGYDQSFREADEVLRTAGFDTVLDDAEPVFRPAACPDAALYAGWYSVGNYVPALTLNKGAVAWHLASYEAVNLRDGKSRQWCPNLLAAGAAVTLGPVAEPFTVGFPKPAEFFALLATGKYTVAEVFARTTLLTSWQMVLLADPLYNPFRLKPRLAEAEVRPSPR
jgi:uncharacterized protein (TIGR03790 family)